MILSKLVKIKKLLNVKKINLLYKLLYAIGFIFLVIFILQNKEQLFLSLSQLNIINLIYSFILYPIGMIPTAMAWHYLLKTIDQNRKILKDIYLYNLSLFSKHIPGYIWFLGSRSLVYKNENISNINTIFLTFLETFMLSITGFILSLPLIWSNRDLFPEITLKFIFLFCISIMMIILLISLDPTRRILKRITKKIIPEDYVFTSLKNKNFLFSLLIMFVGWIGGGIMLLFVIRGFIPIQFNTLLLACGIWGFSGAVSLSLGVVFHGFGIREITTALLLSVILTPIQAASASVIFRIVLSIAELFWVTVISYLGGYFYNNNKSSMGN